MTRFLSQFPDLADFLETLSRKEVKYMVVGGHAVSFHAKPRATKDLDVWFEPSDENRKRLLSAMREYGVPTTILATVQIASSSDIIWFGRPPSRIDLLQILPGLSFEQAYANAEQFVSNGERITIIGIKELILNKRTVARPQDLADTVALEASVREFKDTP